MDGFRCWVQRGLRLRRRLRHRFPTEAINQTLKTFAGLDLYILLPLLVRVALSGSEYIS